MKIINAKYQISSSKKIDGIYDLTESGEIYLLPEAAMQMGVAYISSIKPAPGQNEKIVLGGHTTKEQVTEFMSKYRELGYKVYGNPHRGFAGAIK